MSRAAHSTYRQRVIEQVSDVPEEYLPALLRVVSAFRESVALGLAEESVRRGWAEAQRGDYTAERGEWLGDESLEELFKQIQEADRKRNA